MSTSGEPTYIKDIAGEIQRWDERDIVFARKDLFRYFGDKTDQFKAYYQDHPEHIKFDKQISKQKPLGADNLVDTPMFAAQFAFLDDLGEEKMVDGEPSLEKQIISEDRAKEKVKSAARMYGADMVKIGPLKQEWTYSNVGCTIGNSNGYPRWGAPINLSNHQHAIAMGFRMDLDLLSSAPFFPTLLATAQAYALSAWTADRLALYIRQMGYSARAHHFSNYQVLAVPVAVDCGLGELSRAGYLLTREYGLGVRLSIVTTEMPISHDDPVDIAVQSFCGQCRICADECPSGAIPKGGKQLANGVRKWKLNEEKCYAYWHVNGTDCGICMAVCPWTKPQTPFHRFSASVASIQGPHQRWMAWADRAIYGRHNPAPFPDFLNKD